MVTALVLLSVEHDKTNAVAEKITAIPGVTEVYSVAGRYDLAVIIRVKENDQLASVVTDQIRKVEGIERSETLIAFRVYSRFDLESAFSLGMEPRRAWRKMLVCEKNKGAFCSAPLFSLLDSCPGSYFLRLTSYFLFLTSDLSLPTASLQASSSPRHSFCLRSIRVATRCARLHRLHRTPSSTDLSPVEK